MAVDVDKRVQTTFTVIDKVTAQTRRMAKSMASLARTTQNTKRIIASMKGVQAASTRAVVNNTRAVQKSAGATRTASKAHRQFRSNINNVRYSILGMTAAAVGFFAAMETRKIIKISDDFEQTRIAIAGTLQSLGFSKDFERAMNISAAAMEKIRIQAALLPGEAHEYVEVFRMGLAGMRGGIKGTINDMVEFSGKYTAITKTMKIDAPQAGRDLALMLSAGRGRAGAMVRSFRQLLPTMREIPKHANLTAKAFNMMSQTARGDLLQQVLAKHKDAIEASKKTWDAQAGAMKSNIDLIRRLGGAPLFKGMKASLEFMNNKLMDMETGALMPMMKSFIGIGEAISKGIVAGMSAAVALAKELYALTNKAIGAINQISGGGKAKGAADAVGGAAAAVGAAAVGAAAAAGGGAAAVGGGADAGGAVGGGMGAAAGAAAGFAALLIGATGPMGLLVAGLVNFSTRTEAVGVVMGEISRMGEMLLTPFTALARASMVVSTMLGDVLEGALGGFISMITDTFAPVFGFLANVVNDGIQQFQILQPMLKELWKAVGNLFTGIGKFLNPIIRILGTALTGLMRIVRFFVTPIINVLGTVVMAITTVLGELLKAMGRGLSWFADSFDDVTGIDSTGVSKTGKDAAGTKDWLGDLFKSFESKTKPGPTDPGLMGATAPTTPGSRGGGGRAYQDFRYSRFTIDQKFAEGFDPDRIAVAFANDIGKIGETKLQSGFEPLFSLQ